MIRAMNWPGCELHSKKRSPTVPRIDSDLSGMVPTAQMNGASSGGSQQSTMTIDARQIGKPDQFEGDAKEYADWSFVFKSYMSCIKYKYLGLFARLDQTRSPVPNRMMNDADNGIQLYFVLVMLVKGRPLENVQNAGQGEGAEAFRKLEELYHPRIASRFLCSLSQILSTRFTNDVEAELEQFEKIIRRYAAESGKVF